VRICVLVEETLILVLSVLQCGSCLVYSPYILKFLVFIMKFSIPVISVLVGTTVALPELSKRQVSNELSGPCNKVTFVWARASTETNNMVRTRRRLDRR
jgi:hypothetical protein